MSIDTLEIARQLAGAGFTQTQAEAVSKVLYEQRALDLAEIATKADIAELRAELLTALVGKAELGGAIAPLATKAELAEMKYEMTWRMIGITATMNGILFALLHFVR